MITRRLALTGLAAAAAAAPALAQAPAIRISTAAPPSDFLARLLERLKTDLDGQLAVTVHAASTLFRQGTEVQALQRGNLEMSTMTTFEVAQQVPELGFLNRGYLFRDYTHMRAAFEIDVRAKFGIWPDAHLRIDAYGWRNMDRCR